MLRLGYISEVPLVTALLTENINGISKTHEAKTYHPWILEETTVTTVFRLEGTSICMFLCSWRIHSDQSGTPGRRSEDVTSKPVLGSKWMK